MRIARRLAQLTRADTAEPNNYVDSAASLAAELDQDELDEGLADDLRRQPPLSGPSNGSPRGRVLDQSGRMSPDPSSRGTPDRLGHRRRRGSG
jgi:hypothetical protein